MDSRRRARSSQSLKSAGCIIVTNEPHNVGDPVSSGVISIKSMGELSARAEINVHCCRATCRRPEFESSIRRRDRHLIIREWVLHSQDGIFGTDKLARKLEEHVKKTDTRFAAVYKVIEKLLSPATRRK